MIMNNLFVKGVFASCLFSSVLLTSCSNDINSQSVDDTPKKVAVTLSIPQIINTKGIADESTTGAKVTIEGNIVLLAKNSSGATMNTFTIPVTDFSGTNADGYTKTFEVNGTASRILVEGNVDNSIHTADVNTRQGASTSSAVRVTGSGNIQAGIGNTPSKCAVEVAPEMARVEIKGALGATTNLTDLKINGIYLNNIKENRTATSLTMLSGTTEFDAAYTANGSRSNLYNDFGSTPIIEFAAGKADGYNFYPQSGVAPAQTKEEASKYHPHVILNVSFKKQGETTIQTAWLNVVALKDNTGTYFASFDNSKVYQLDLNDIKEIIDVVNPPVTPEPDPDAVSVDLKVTVKGWDVVTAKPEV